MVARALRVILKSLGSRTWRLWNLSRFAEEFEKRLANLERAAGAETVCAACGALKELLTLRRGDANAYYTRVQQQHIEEAVDAIVEEVTERTSRSTVTVRRQLRWKGLLGGSTESTERDRVVLTFGEI